MILPELLGRYEEGRYEEGRYEEGRYVCAVQ